MNWKKDNNMESLSNKESSLIEQINSVDYIVRQLHKIDSKLLAGQTILAWRSNRKLIAEIEKTKTDLTKLLEEMKSSANKNTEK